MLWSYLRIYEDTKIANWNGRTKGANKWRGQKEAKK